MLLAVALLYFLLEIVYLFVRIRKLLLGNYLILGNGLFPSTFFEYCVSEFYLWVSISKIMSSRRTPNISNSKIFKMSVILYS